MEISCLHLAAVSCAERGVRSHLLLRGEQPEVLTGYNLVSTMYGDVQYIPRTRYANREEMLTTHADLVAGEDGSVLWAKDIVEAMDDAKKDHLSRKVLVLSEGAGDALALLGKNIGSGFRHWFWMTKTIVYEGLCHYAGMFRLVKYLSQEHLLGKKRPIKFVVDAGTGTTAVGLGVAAMSLGLGFVHQDLSIIFCVCRLLKILPSHL